MSWPHIAIYLVVFGIGLPAAFRNPTALALMLNWAIGEFSWLVTGDALPLKVYFMADVAVITAIFAKATLREGPATYPNLGVQLRAFWRSMTMWDRLVAGGFILAAWPLYAFNMDARAKWFALWAILICQFLAAGAESLQSMLGERKARNNMHHPPGGPGLAFARTGGHG